MDNKFDELEKLYPSLLEHLNRKWRFANLMCYRPKIEYAVRYYILVKLNG